MSFAMWALIGAHHRYPSDHNGLVGHVAEAITRKHRHALSGRRLRARPGGLGLDGPASAGGRRHPGTHGGSHRTHLAIRHRPETKSAIVAPALASARSSGLR